MANKVQELSETGQKHRSKSCCNLLCLPSPSLVLAFPFLYFPFISFGSRFFMPYCFGFPFLGFSFQAIHGSDVVAGAWAKKLPETRDYIAGHSLAMLWPCNLFLKVEKETLFMGCQNRSETAHHIIINTFFLPFPYSSFLFANQHLLCSLSLLFLPSFCPFIACLFLRAFLFLFFLHGIQLSSHAWARCSNSGCLDKIFRILHWRASAGDAA